MRSIIRQIRGRGERVRENLREEKITRLIFDVNNLNFIVKIKII